MNIGRSFELMKIQDELRKVTGETMFGFQIKIGVKGNQWPEVISNIRDQLKDNRRLVIQVIGEKCVTLIDKL